MELYVKKIAACIEAEDESLPFPEAEFVKKWQNIQRPENVPESVQTIIVLDDNFYYRSMRHIYLQIARDFGYGFANLVVTVDLEVALLRNGLRQGAERIPDGVVNRMSELFELPLANSMQMQDKRSSHQVIGSGGAGGVGFSYILDNNSSRDTLLASESPLETIWNLVASAASSPLAPLVSQTELNARKQDSEKTKKNTMHKLDQALRTEVRSILKESSKLGLIGIIPDLGKGLARKSREYWRITETYLNHLPSHAIVNVLEELLTLQYLS